MSKNIPALDSASPSKPGRKTERLTRLAALLQAVTASLDPQRVFEAVVDGSLQLLNVTMARLWVVEPSAGEIVLVARASSPERPVNFEGVATRLPKSRGIPGWVVDQRRPRYSPILGDDPLSARPEWVKREGFVSQLAVPLLGREEALGALAVTARERREFSPDEQELLGTFAATAALAIENARLHDETQKRLSQTETLLAVGQAVGSTLDLAEIGRRTVREMVRVLGADMGGAWRFSSDRDRLFPVAGYHVPKEWADLFSSNPLAAADSLVAEVKRLQGPLYASDSQNDPRLDHPLARLIPHKSVLIYPMWLKGKIIGGFAIIWAREVHHLTPEEMRLAEGIAGQAAIAVENARLHEELIAQMAALKRTEAQLIQSAKLAALGELATQIAHEINNPMTSILGYASLAVKDPDLPLTIRRDMEVIIQESLRTRRIVKDLLDFARRREPCMEPGDLSAALRSVIELLREPIALGNVLLVEKLAPLPQVFMDSDQIKQVLVNLINNALDAMPGGGTLTVTTGVRGSGRMENGEFGMRNSALPTPHSAFEQGRGLGEQVEATVADTGIGMSQEQIQQIFDPFFTTKGEGRGTGLGLSVSLRIMEAHGGRILVESQPGQGSVFRVILPLRTPHAAAKSADFMERNG